jgi:hypothetical protein
MSGCEDSEAANAVRLFPRRKVGDRQAVAPEKGRLPVSFDLRTVGAFFSMPQAEAAQELGISLTALKQVCRKLGVVRWPYRRPKKRGSLSKDAAAGSCLHPVSGAPSLSAAAVHVTDDDVASSCETTDECMSDSGGSSVSSTTSSPRRETKYARLVADVDFQRPGVVAVAPDGESPCDESGLVDTNDDMNWLVPAHEVAAERIPVASAHDIEAEEGWWRQQCLPRPDLCRDGGCSFAACCSVAITPEVAKSDLLAFCWGA